MEQESMKTFSLLLNVLLILAFAGSARAFTGEGCGTGECKDCHNMTREEAATILKDFPGRVEGVKLSEVPGLWVVDLEQNDRKIPIYIDFSKQFLITGRVVRLDTREDMTEKHFLAINKVDVAGIPLADALILGSPEAANKIIVFDDPECNYCRKLHDEMKAVVNERSDIAFFIKMFPLVKLHPKAYDKAKTIICEKSLQLLEDSLNGKEIPEPGCETDQVDKNLELGPTVFVRSTPTLILPDGRVIPGFKTAAQIISLVDETKSAQPQTAGDAAPEKKEMAE
jgi:thiol:disulfide interchange protein DsbC